MAFFKHLKHLLVSVGADTGRFFVHGAVYVRTVIKGAVLFPYWPPSSLVHEVPIEAGERPVLSTFMLKEQLTLLYAEFF